MKKKKTIKKIRLSKYDKLWSILIRKKGRCEKCLSRNSLNAHHIIGRAKKSTRLLVENGLCLCAGCHVFRTDSVHRSPEGSKAFCIKIIGAKKYAELERLGAKPMQEREAIKRFINETKNTNPK